MRQGLHIKPKRKCSRSIVLICIASIFTIALGVGLFASLPSQSVEPTVNSDIGTQSSAPDLKMNEKELSSDPVDEYDEELSDEVTHYALISPDEYESQTVIVSINNEQAIQSLWTQLSTLDYIVEPSLNTNDLSYGFVTLTYSGSASSGEVADCLQALGIVAQPNFIYCALDEAAEEDSNTELANPSNALDGDAGSAIESKDPTDELGAIAENEPNTHDPELQGESSDDADLPLSAQTTSIDDPRSNEQWALQAIYARDAWDIAKCRPGPGAQRHVNVAIIDSGCNVNHPDLKNNIVGAYDTRTDDRNVADEQNHGTPVAGIIAAEANNSIGVAGISYNAGLYIVRALHRDADGKFSAQSSDIIKAYRHIIDTNTKKGTNSEKIRIVNMSLGSKRDGSLGESDTAVMEIVNEAYVKHGILTVSAAGNGDSALPYRCFPCDFSDGVIGVINLNKNLARSGSSNYNVGNSMTKQLSAPGTDILTTTSGGGYGNISGTSMATPYITGVAALALAANPNLSARDLKNILYSAADDLGVRGFDREHGYGMINARHAVQLAKAGTVISGPDSISVGTTASLGGPGASNWASSNTSVATVSASGTVSGHKAGYTSISATVNGRTIQKMITVYDGTICGSNSLFVGNTSQYKINCSLDGSWSFEIESGQTAATITKTGKLTARQAGQAVVLAKLDSNPSITIKTNVSIRQAMRAPVYRLFNPASGEHLYTEDANEKRVRSAQGWRYEGVRWYGTDSTGRPVYRLFNPASGEHLYTEDANEKRVRSAQGWRYEGVRWYGVK